MTIETRRPPIPRAQSRKMKTLLKKWIRQGVSSDATLAKNLNLEGFRDGLGNEYTEKTTRRYRHSMAIPVNKNRSNGTRRGIAKKSAIVRRRKHALPASRRHPKNPVDLETFIMKSDALNDEQKLAMLKAIWK